MPEPSCPRCGANPDVFFRVWDPHLCASIFLCGPCSANRAIVRHCSCCSGAGLLVTLQAGRLVEPVSDPGATNGR